MSWHYSQALEEAFSEACSSDGAPSAPWRSTPSALDDSCSGKMKGTCHRSPFGMMFVPSTDARGEALLTWFRGAFPARTSVLPERVQESTESEAGYGVKWPASFARYNRDTRSWKTAQLSLFEDLGESSVTWPRWGWMHDGGCWVQSTRVPLIDEKESGLLPTPTASGYGSCQGGSAGREGQPNRPSLQTMARRALWPTPNAWDGIDSWALQDPQRWLERHANKKREGINLQFSLRVAVQMWQTPVADDAVNRKIGKYNSRGEPRLSAQVLFPTPQSRDYKGAPGKGCRERGGHQSSLPAEVGGQLNPTWVELLMGWPENWSCIDPISHVRYSQWLMENCNDEETRVREVLPVLRCGHAAEEVSRAIGRPVGIREAAVLLADVCQHANRPDQARVFMACAEALEGDVRIVRPSVPIAGASHEPRHPRQPTGEHPDVVQTLSRLLAHYGKAAWQDGSWENAVPRVAHKVAARVDRLKAIGNGQVPAVVRLAWETLK